MATLHHQVWIDAPINRVYSALATAEGLGQWWAPHQSEVIDGATVLSHSPGKEHGDVQMKIIDAVANQRIEWEIISEHPAQSPASAWTGAHIIFELAQEPSPGRWMGQPREGEPLTVLNFQHAGWDESSRFFGFCNYAWGVTLDGLKRWCESQESNGL